MHICTKHTLKMSLSIILTALVVVTAFIYSGATTPFLNNEAAFAAACDASPTATPIVAATSTPGSCDMGMNIMAQAGSLSAIAPANVTMSDGTGAGAGHITGGTGTSGDPYTYTLNGASQTFNLAFTTLLSDYRGGTTGWNLQANTGSLPGGSSATITSASATCTSTCYPAANSLSTPSFPLSLSSSPAEFIGAIAATSGNFNTGDYTLATTGTLTLPNIPAGTTVNGTLTLTLNDADYV